MNVQKLLDKTVTERISQIIENMELENGNSFQEEEGVILESLDNETQKKFETLIDSLVAREAAQNQEFIHLEIRKELHNEETGINTEFIS